MIQLQHPDLERGFQTTDEPGSRFSLATDSDDRFAGLNSAPTGNAEGPNGASLRFDPAARKPIKSYVDASITLDGALKQCLGSGVVVLDPRGQVTCINPAAADLLSFQPGLPVPAQALPPPVLEFVNRALKNPGETAPTEVRLGTGSETHRVLTLEASPISFDGGQPGLLLLLHGTHPGNPLETQVRHFERLARLGVLSAGLAHELRNSMVALSTMADLLLEQQQDNELAHTVRRELDRANSLAVRMLKYARPDTPSRQRVSTHEILDRAIQLAHSRIKEAGASLTKSLVADPDLISADEAHLEQLFLNLLINAADAVKESGEVMLTTEIIQDPTVGCAVRIEVRDNGVGIPVEVLPKLFQPFFTTKRHGTGLGLYLARRIVGDHSGTIQVKSVPGQGTRVQVCLPVHDE